MFGKRKILKKRKAQGAIEYLFMVAAILIVVAIAIRYLKTAGRDAGQTVSQGVQDVSNILSTEMQEAAGAQS